MEGIKCQGLLEGISLADSSSIRRVLSGIRYYLHHVVLTVNPMQLKGLTSQELAIAGKAFSHIRTHREFPLILHATLLLLDKTMRDDETLVQAAKEYNFISSYATKPHIAVKEYEDAKKRFNEEVAAAGIDLPSNFQLKETAPGAFNQQIFSSKRAARIAELAKMYDGDVRRIPASVQLGLQPQPEGVPITINTGACVRCTLNGHQCNQTEPICLYCRISWDVCQYEGQSSGVLVGMPVNVQVQVGYSGAVGGTAAMGSGLGPVNAQGGLGHSRDIGDNHSSRLTSPSRSLSPTPDAESDGQYESGNGKSKHACIRQAGDTVIDDGSYDRTTAKVNVPDQSKLQIQLKVINNQSENKEVKVVTYTYPSEVDWSSKESVEKLKKWRSQVFGRNLGGKIKPRLSWTETERVILCNILQEHLTTVGGRYCHIDWNHVTTTFNSQVRGTIQHAGEPLSERYNIKRKDERKSNFLKSDREAPFRSSSALRSQIQRFAHPDARELVSNAKAKDDEAQLATEEDLHLVGIDGCSGDAIIDDNDATVDDELADYEEMDDDDISNNGYTDDEYMDDEDVKEENSE